MRRASAGAFRPAFEQQLRPLAVRESALGIETLERLARGEPLGRVHECVLALLALESEP